MGLHHGCDHPHDYVHDHDYVLHRSEELESHHRIMGLHHGCVHPHDHDYVYPRYDHCLQSHLGYWDQPGQLR
ncbi:hypothetical protein CWATWH0402_5252 [Crocosphaera watsonii WH 0402]|uniref:Uncharacterized protein n=1 Tax=Crocosphaera watsonii WH 0402 TaxID=1284629 RepID=T2JXV6_CROWT|nr:hypothetical protein CWATWH0402_5252 [Crocosphaera watsonii WH 0402]